MVQTPQPTNNQSENKSSINISSAPPVISPEKTTSPFPINDAKSIINMNTQHSGQQFKLSTNEVQGPKPPLVNGKGSKFALVAAIFVLIIIAGIGGYYIYSNDGALEPASSPIAVIPTSTPEIDKNSDSDKDGLPDLIEKILGTYMTKADTDGDGFDDLNEIKNGYSPLISGSVGKYSPEEWDLVKGKIKIEDREFYEREFEAAAVSPSPTATPASLSFNCGIDTVSDIDNNVYNTVKIGEQCWLKENLKVTKNPAGEVIIRYCYDNDPKICDTDGGLYDWNTAMNKSTAEGAQGICMTGWHVPKDSEWYDWEKYLKDSGQICDATDSSSNCDISGIKFKTDSVGGFGNIFAGDRDSNGTFGNRNKGAWFWSSSKSSYDIWSRFMYSSNVEMYREAYDKATGFSVRCLKD